MTYEVHICSRKRFVWVPIPNAPGFVKSYDWPGAKDYSEIAGLPVRELDARGVVTREYYPAVVDDVP